MVKKSETFESLNGLRGVAAISVIFSHLFYWYYPYLHTGKAVHATVGDVQDFLFNSPFTFFYKGNAAVWIFFVLSGFVLSRGALRRQDSLYDLRVSAKKRYFRLGLPVFFSVMICFLLMCLGVFKAREFGLNAFLSSHYTFEPSLLSALWDGTFGALLFADTKYNYVLWTIRIELWGSFLVFASMALFGDNKRLLRILSVSAFLVFAACPHVIFFSMSLFCAGLFIATFEVDRNAGNGRLLAAVITLAAGCYLAGYHYMSDSYITLADFARSWDKLTGLKVNWMRLYPALGAVLIMTCVLVNIRIFNLLESHFFRWLGRISYSVYLLHSFVLAIVAAYVSKYMGDTPLAVATCGGIILIVTLFVSHFFCVHIDERFTHIVNRKFRRHQAVTEPKAGGRETQLFLPESPDYPPRPIE